jgi:hypothetical protein
MARSTSSLSYERVCQQARPGEILGEAFLIGAECREAASNDIDHVVACAGFGLAGAMSYRLWPGSRRLGQLALDQAGEVAQMAQGRSIELVRPGVENAQSADGKAALQHQWAAGVEA